jgi:hypothetical protein
MKEENEFIFNLFFKIFKELTYKFKIILKVELIQELT